MSVTIKDIAELSNTSISSVSRVLSGKPGVEHSKRKRILQLAQKLGYMPNRLARNLALQKSYVLGFIAADLFNKVYIDFLRYVQSRVEEMGYQVLIADSERNADKEAHNIQMMRAHQAEGLIIFPVHDWSVESSIEHLLDLRLKKFPFVVMGKLESVNFDTITSDDVLAGETLTRHLIQLGHRKIGFVGFDDQNRPVIERFTGVKNALSEAGCSIPEKYIIMHREGWPQDMIKLLKQEDRPSALVFMNDVLALIAHRSLQEMGIRIPEDISIATFDNGIWTSHLKPSITTTSERVREEASSALDLLFRRIEDPDAPHQQILVPQDFIQRESTGPA